MLCRHTMLESDLKFLEIARWPHAAIHTTQLDLHNLS